MLPRLFILQSCHPRKCNSVLLVVGSETSESFWTLISYIRYVHVISKSSWLIPLNSIQRSTTPVLLLPHLSHRCCYFCIVNWSHTAVHWRARILLHNWNFTAFDQQLPCPPPPSHNYCLVYCTCSLTGLPGLPPCLYTILVYPASVDLFRHELNHSHSFVQNSLMVFYHKVAAKAIITAHEGPSRSSPGPLWPHLPPGPLTPAMWASLLDLEHARHAPFWGYLYFLFLTPGNLLLQTAVWLTASLSSGLRSNASSPVRPSLTTPMNLSCLLLLLACFRSLHVIFAISTGWNYLFVLLFVSVKG